MKLLCLSFQPDIHHRLHFMIVWISDTTKTIFQILKQIIVTVHQVTSVCRVILLYKARGMSSLLGDCRLVGSTAVSDLGESICGLLPDPTHEGPPCKKWQILFTFLSAQLISVTVKFLVTFYGNCQIMTWHHNWLQCSYLRLVQILAIVYS